MTRPNFINRFKNHIKIGGKNHVAHADAAVIEMFINSNFVNNTLIIKCLTLICSVKMLSMRRITNAVRRVCQL